MPQQVQEWQVTKPWLNKNCALGEGPFYEQETDSLRFVDIKKKQLLYVKDISAVSAQETAPELEILQLDVCPTVTSDIEGVDPRERILLGTKYGIEVLNRKTGKHDLLVPFGESHNERVRGNDGAADPLGGFLLGTMTDFGQGEVQPEAALYRFTKSDRTQLLNRLTIPNGISWSPDHKTMYFTHSPTREVFAYTYDPSTGAMSDKRVFYKHEGSGEPDGHRVDVEGNVWHAVHGESMVLRINPAGEVTGRIRLPTRGVTCVQFVGEELFITTAEDEIGSSESESVKLGGAVFRVHVGVRGVDLFKFKM